jgi:hypothetical protein
MVISIDSFVRKYVLCLPRSSSALVGLFNSDFLLRNVQMCA